MEIEILYKEKNGFLNSEIISVSNFEVETIRKLSFYKEDYYSFKLIKNGIVYKTIYAGKKISFADLLKIIGNDAKYKPLLTWLGILKQRAYLKQNKVLDEESFFEDYMQNHYALFTLPAQFDVTILQIDKTAITIEEFDKDCKLPFKQYLQAIILNSKASSLYLEENSLLLTLFSNYFQMISKMVWEIVDNENDKDNVIEIMLENEDNIKSLFRICTFNFEELGKKDFKEIEEFLSYFPYYYDMDRMAEQLFIFYKQFLNEQRGEIFKR